MASKGKRYTEKQIIRILKEVESGTTVAEVCRPHRFRRTTDHLAAPITGGLRQ